METLMNNPFRSVVSKETSVAFYLAPFQPYLEDPQVTEIAVNAPGFVFTEKLGHWEEHEAPQLDYAYMYSLGKACAKYAGDNLDFSGTTPILSAVLPGGYRSQFVMPPACRDQTVSMTVRKPSFEIRTVDDYLKNGFFDKVKPADSGNDTDRELSELFSQIHCGENKAQKRAEFLTRCVETGKNIVIAGETGSGKTTFMKALMQSIPQEERIITIEDVPELLYGLPNHRNQVNLFYPSEAKADSLVTASSLMRSCLRMKPDRILLAELRGAETFDFLNVCLSGHRGSITSCHAGSCRGVFEYLTLKVQQSEAAKTMKYEEIQKLLYLTVDVVVHVHNDRKEGRHITEIWFDPSVKESLKRKGKA